MIEKIAVAIAVKLFELLVSYLEKRINSYSAKIEKGNLREEETNKLLEEIDNAVSKAGRIQAAINVLNVKRL